MSIFTPAVTIGRISYLFISSAIYALLIAWLMVCASLATLTITAMNFSHLGTQPAPTIIGGIGLIFFTFSIVGIFILQYKFAVAPRLRDIGFSGTLHTIMAALWVAPPSSPLLMLALYFMPSGFIQEQQTVQKNIRH